MGLSASVHVQPVSHSAVAVAAAVAAAVAVDGGSCQNLACCWPFQMDPSSYFACAAYGDGDFFNIIKKKNNNNNN